MRPVARYGVTWSTNRSVCHRHEPCKHDWSNQAAIWVWTQVGSRNQVLYECPDPHTWRDNFKGEKGPVQDMSTGWYIQSGSAGGSTGTVRMLTGVHNDTTWRIQLNHPCTAATWPYVKLLWPFVFGLASVSWCTLILLHSFCTCVFFQNSPKLVSS